MGLRLLPLILSIVIVVVALITVVVGFSAHFDSEWLKMDKEKHESNSVNFDNGLHNFCDDDKINSAFKEDYETFQQLPKDYQESLNYPKFPSHCPNIAMEQAFLGLALFCFLGAIASVVLVVLNKGDNKHLKSANAILQAVLAVMIFIGAILFIVSAVQAEEIYNFFLSRMKLSVGFDPGSVGKPGESQGPAQSSQPKGSTTMPRSKGTNPLSPSVFENLGMFSSGRPPTGDFDLDMKYEVKLVAGAIGIIQAILHAVAACVMMMMMRGSGNVQPMDSQHPQQPNAQPDPNATNQGEQEPQAKAES